MNPNESTDIDILRGFFSLKRAKYTFVLLDDERMLNTLLDSVSDKLERKGKVIHHFLLKENDISIYRQVLQYTQQKQIDGIMVSGINELIDQYGTPCVDMLNKSRDAFVHTGLPIIWIINRNTLGKIIRGASDFYQMRHFPDIEIQSTIAEQKKWLDIHFFYDPSLNDIDTDTNYLETQLAALPKQQRHEKETINGMVLSLLKIYLQRNQRKPLKKLYATYIKGYEERVYDLHLLISYDTAMGHLAKSSIFFGTPLSTAIATSAQPTTPHAAAPELLRALHEKRGAVTLLGSHGPKKTALIAYSLTQLQQEGYDFVTIYGETSPELILQQVALKAQEKGDTQALKVLTGKKSLEEKLEYYLTHFFYPYKIACVFFYFEENQSDIPGGGCQSTRLKIFLQRCCEALKKKESLFLFSTSIPTTAFFVVETQDQSTPPLSLQQLEQLPPRERQLLEVLAIFRHPIEAEALRFFDMEPEEREPLHHLNHLNLLEILPTPDQERPEANRYFVPLQVARIVQEQMDKEKIRQYHLTAGEYIEKYRTDEETSYMMNVFQTRQHFIAAAEWNLATELTLKLFWPIYTQNFLSWALELFNALAIEKLSERLQFQVQRRLGVLHYYSGAYSSSWTHYEKALELVPNEENRRQLISEILPIEMVVKQKYLFSDNRIFKGISKNIEVPPVEVIKLGPNAILNYLNEIATEASIRLLACKIILVGNGEVGKTTLMKKLTNPAFHVSPGQEETTHSIHIQPWQLVVPFTEPDGKITQETVELDFWDFGGQDIYHATHQFFLTRRSLYLFVWESKKEGETRSFDYWLNMIKLLSGNSPVIVVKNKSDRRIKHIDEAGYKAQFPNIESFHQVSCLTNEGISELTEAIRQSLSHMPHLQDRLPRVWAKIRDRLKLKKRHCNYISLHYYSSLCGGYGLNKERAEYLSEYLHDLGVILHFQNDPLLRDTFILNPEWVTHAVYTLIDTRDIQNNKGCFNFEDLKRYWDAKKYPHKIHPQLTRLMERFEFCFNFSGTQQYFIPELMSPYSEAMDLSPFQSSASLRFQYHYDFMHHGIVNRFISRLFYLIQKRHFWKNGVVLTFEDSKALVMGEPLNRRVTIAITGPNKKELLAIIRSHFDHIHTSLNMEKNIHYYEMVPCICNTCRASSNPQFYKYDQLKKAYSRQMTEITCMKSYEPVSIANLLNGIEPPTPKHDLKSSIITVVAQLQGLAKSIKKDEDSRNGFISLLLSSQGYGVKDQTRWGRSATGKSISEVDIKIESANGQVVSLIEAFNLNFLNKVMIKSHINKLFSYDVNPPEANFILVYADAKNFNRSWQEYFNYLANMDYPYPLIGLPKEEATPFEGIRLAHTRHNRSGKEIHIYHIFADMRPQPNLIVS